MTCRGIAGAKPNTELRIYRGCIGEASTDQDIKTKVLKSPNHIMGHHKHPQRT